MKPSFGARVLNWYKRNAAVSLYRRTVAFELKEPIISFTFDDYPQSALYAGGAILKENGAAGTFYVSLGLLDTDAPAGRLCRREDVAATVQDGHELGCHTYSHCHSWDTQSREYERALMQNQAALKAMFPGRRFESFSYPIALPRPSVKRVCAKLFSSCRGGGQVSNVGKTDLNQLSAYFLEKVGGDLEPVKRVIEQNMLSKGWLIFATHDVVSRPSPYGCTPEFFRDVVKCSIGSGARILTVREAADIIRANASPASN